MAGLEAWQILMFLNRNQNALAGKQVLAAGTQLAPGLYWDLRNRRLVSVERGQPAPGDCVKLADRPDAKLEEVTRTFALGGGGRSGDPGPFEP